MKILIATGIYPPSIGGPATYAKLLHDELPQRGIHVRVISFDSVVHLPKGISHFVYFCKIFTAAFSHDVVYALDPVSVGVPSLVAARLAGKNFLVRIAGDYAWEQGTQRSGVVHTLDEFSAQKTGYPFFVRLLQYVQTFVARQADKIIVPSNYLKRIIAAWGVDAQHIKVIYNAFEQVALPQETYDEMRKKMALEGPLLISVGRLVPWKGFAMLIEVIAEISLTIKNIKLLIVGDGPDKEKLQHKITAFGVGESVMLTGKMSQKELFKYIRASDVFILNTQYEGFSHQLLEVMAIGTPIVTTSVGGNLELVEHSKDGLLVPYNDKAAIKAGILTLLKMEGESKRLTEAAKKKVAFFSTSKAIAEIVDVLHHYS